MDPILVAELRGRLRRHDLRWLLGAAGAGKSTVAQILVGRHDLQLIDLDAHIYGDWHSRFTPERHPANHEWTAAPSSLDWLLTMTWSGYDQFQRAALFEYLDLLTQDLERKPAGRVLLDGGLYHPALLAGVLPADRIVCLTRPQRTAGEVWDSSEERRAMRHHMDTLSDPDTAWARFLEIDEHIAVTVAEEATRAGLTLIARGPDDSPENTAEAVARAFSL
ncbi:MAG: hypothetical protein GY745_16960 [Actinomycetia bacterium]|nr:hypothetical protein [Actinomycetes bacterium]